MMAIAVCCYLKLSDNKIRLYNKFYLEALAEQ